MKLHKDDEWVLEFLDEGGRDPERVCGGLHLKEAARIIRELLAGTYEGVEE